MPGYEQHKQKTRERQAKLARAGQDIGPIPAPVNLERKAAACASLRKFCETYFQHRFYLGWSADHLRVIARFEEAILSGGRYALAMPRASGKTSIAECACLWAMFIGAHKFVLLIGPSRQHALYMLETIKDEVSSNEELGEDFPEVCFPIGQLEDRANRCKGQHAEGEKTRSVWGVDKIVLPTIAGSRASGAVLRVVGITGSIRGAKKNSLRPSLCILDDPQTDGSANSLSQCEKRIRIISGAMMGLAGPGKKITAIMPCTVIRQGDLADTFLDRTKSPLWTGERFSLVHQFPTNTGLWEQYATMRADEFRNGGDGTEATAFYAANREAMDQGAAIAWPERHNTDELSGIQYAMNLLYADKWSFHAEYQNSPLAEDLGEGQLESDKIGSRINGLARGIVPLACNRITGFIDVQQNVLYWLLTAWGEDFSGSIIDYGTWPDQQRRYFTAADCQRTLTRQFPGTHAEAQILAGLGECAGMLLGRSFAREDGASFKIERLLVDAGFKGEVVKQWTRTTPYAALVMPSHGHGIGAAAKPWSEYDRTRCEKLGLHWMIPKANGSKAYRHVTIDTNFWKSFVRSRLQQGIGDKGSLTIYGKPGQDHRMLADHLTSEYFIETEGRGRKLHEWRTRPSQTENHWWDGLVGSAVAASMQGVSLIEGTRQASNQKATRADFDKKRREFEQRRGY